MKRFNKVYVVLALMVGIWACEADKPVGLAELPEGISDNTSVKAEFKAEPKSVKKPVELGIVAEKAHMFEPAPGQAHGAVYMVLSNIGDKARQLVDISTAIAGTAMVHRTYYENGMMRMRHVHHLDLGPKQTLAFEPKGYHIMLMDLESVPEAGGMFILTMAFDQGQSISVEVEVKRQR